MPIENDMKKLFERAEKEGLWFYFRYQDMWFSPRELREEQERGNFLFGQVNWDLRDPQDEISRIDARIQALKEQRGDMVKRIIKHCRGGV